MNVLNEVDSGFINMPEREVFQQVLKCMDAQFFFQQVGPLRTYALEVLNR